MGNPWSGVGRARAQNASPRLWIIHTQELKGAHRFTVLCLPSSPLDHLQDTMYISLYHAGLAFVAYLALVQLLRFSRLRRIERKYGNRWRTGNNGKRRLDVTPAEAQEIMHISLKYDIPGIARFSTAWALFKTYAIPSISKILVKSGQLSSSAIVARRYTDTGVLISTWSMCPVVGLTSAPLAEKERAGKEVDPRHAIAVARVNWLHARWPMIRQDDYLYTLSLFLLEPIRWAEVYGWRPLTPLEEEVRSLLSFSHVCLMTTLSIDLLRRTLSSGPRSDAG